MLILNINGPINSGKSTVSRILEKVLSNATFVEIDDLLGDDEPAATSLDFMGRIHLRLDRFDAVIADLKEKSEYDLVVFAYPMVKANYDRWVKHVDENTRFINVTLAPTLEKCLTNRGTRELNDWEINRVGEMYAQGYHKNPYADLTICNDDQTPAETATIIQEFLSKYI